VSIADRIIGSEKVIAVFGGWPSFHDAQVFEFNLDRRGPDLRALVYVFAMTSEVDSKGFYVLKNQSMLGLRFRGLTDFEADSFNHQNVLFDLHISDISRDRLENINFEVSFDGIHGLDAKFRCGSVEVESVEPVKEKTEVKA
jgi:hypothetical protein